jgi:hypothetical protein
MSLFSTNRKTCIESLSLLLGILMSILGCVSISNVGLGQPDPNRFPVKSWNITMDLDQRERFFTQLQNFADKHSLELRSTFYDADKKGFLIILAGDGFDISAISTLHSPREISFDFYNEASPPTSQKTFDELAIDLKSHLKEIPSMIIKEKLKRLKVTMEENQTSQRFPELYIQLQEFAHQHSLEFTTISYDPELETFLVEVNGDSFQITIEVVRSIPGEVNIDFYIYYDKNGDPSSISQKTIDELFNHLKSFFGKIPNVAITEAK